MCYHKGRERRGGMGSPGSAPSHPGQASTGLEGAPARLSILLIPGEVTVQQMASHYTSLHSVVLRRVTRDEETAREAILLRRARLCLRQVDAAPADASRPDQAGLAEVLHV